MESKNQRLSAQIQHITSSSNRDQKKLKDEVNMWKEKTEHRDQKIKDLEKERVSLNQKLCDSENDTKTLEGKVERRDGKIESLKQEVESLQRKLQRREDKIEELQSSNSH